MKNIRTLAELLRGLLADEITAVMQYVEYSAARDSSDHGELHKALLEIHEDFPKMKKQRVALIERESRVIPR